MTDTPFEFPDSNPLVPPSIDVRFRRDSDHRDQLKKQAKRDHRTLAGQARHYLETMIESNRCNNLP